MLKFLKNVTKPHNLWDAARRGDIGTIKKLAAEGADVNAKHEGQMPLHVAAIHKQGEAIKELVKLGGKINAKSDENNTPIMLAIKNGVESSFIELMVQLGADINKGPSEPLGEAAAMGNEDLVRCLLNHGANPNGSVKYPGGPLLAAAGQSTGVVQLLLKAGAKVNPDAGRDSPLAAAAVFGKIDVVRILLAAGADPNHVDNCNETPLMSAVMSKNAEVVQALLAARPNINAKSMDERTALDRAEKLKLPDIINILKRAGAKRGSELPKIEKKEEPRTSWQLERDAILSAEIEPWPAKEGNACLKIEISKDDYNSSFSGTLQYRVVRSEKDSELWARVFGKEDEDGDYLASIEIALTKGENVIQFKIKDKDDKDFTELEGWPIKVN